MRDVSLLASRGSHPEKAPWLFVRSGWAGHDGALRSGRMQPCRAWLAALVIPRVDGGDRQSRWV